MAQKVDPEWAQKVLEDWVRDARAAQSQDSNGKRYTFAMAGARVDALREREDQTAHVIMYVLSSTKLERLVRPLTSGTSVDLDVGIELAQYALGRLKTQQETWKHTLKSDVPQVAADALHSIIWEAAQKLWGDGHYGQAVQRAATFLNAHIQDLCGRHDVSDSTLMAQAFSLNQPEVGKPRLRWPGDGDDLTVKAMRSGMLFFSQGCFLAIRNPSTHTRDELPKQVALEQLATLSTLARWVDGCELVEAPTS